MSLSDSTLLLWSSFFFSFLHDQSENRSLSPHAVCKSVSDCWGRDLCLRGHGFPPHALLKTGSRLHCASGGSGHFFQASKKHTRLRDTVLKVKRSKVPKPGFTITRLSCVTVTMGSHLVPFPGIIMRICTITLCVLQECSLGDVGVWTKVSGTVFYSVYSCDY